MRKLSGRTFVGRTVLAIAVSVWAVAILGGSMVLFKYENTPGVPGASPLHWPAGSRLPRSHSPFTLVLMAHPDCPCTMASMAELEVIMSKSLGKLTSYVIFSKPGAPDTDINSSALWKIAARIPGVTVSWDSTGMETNRFGGRVSGQTMLYGPDGALIFTGGITIGRGHQGDNQGADAITRSINGEAGVVASTPVFGCSLHNPGSDGPSEDPAWKRQ